MNQQQKTQSTCPYCGVGCGVEISELAEGQFSVQGDTSHPANFGRLCTKGRSLADTLSDETRLGFPSINGVKTSWSKSTAFVASKLNQIIAQHGPEAVAFYGSGQMLTEDYYVANKLLKGFIGSANIDTNSRLCMASAVEAHKKSFGRDCVPTTYSDLETADLIVLIGSNLAWCHPVLQQRIRAEKLRRPALKIVVIDPRKTATCELADLHLAINSGTDILLFNALLCYLADNDYADSQYFEANNIEATLAAARAEHSDHLAELLGVEVTEIQQFFKLFATTEKVVSVFSMGINQSTQGVEQGNAIINCHLLTNRIGHPGMGPFSMTGQPNAMGGREVGGLATTLAAHLGFADVGAQQLVSDFWQTERLASAPGLTAVDLFDAVDSGKIKAIWIMATNPVVTMPQTAKIKQALSKCPLVIVSDAFDTSETVQYANVIFPARAWGEKSGTMTNAERRISRQRAFKPAYQQAKPDWWAICEVAKAMGFASAFNFNHEAEIFKEHAELSTLACELTGSFDITALAALNEQQYDRLSPVQWPQSKTDVIELQDKRLFADGQFPTPNGRPNMVPVVYSRAPIVEQAADQHAPLILNTGRNRDQWHTLTRTGVSAQLNQHALEPILSIHPADAKARGLQDGAIVNMMNELGEINIRLQTSEHVSRGNAFVPMHWSGSHYSAGSINQLVRPDTDPTSKQPAFKSSTVSVVASKISSEALLLTRQQLTDLNSNYWVWQKVSNGFLYHIADQTSPEQLLENLTKQLPQTTHQLDGGGNTRLTRTALIDETVNWSLQVSNSRPQLDPSWLTTALSKPLDSTLKCAFLSGQAYGDADKGALVCLCKKIGLKQVKSAISDGQAACVKTVGEATGAGTVCGSCIGDIAFVLEGELAGEQQMRQESEIC